MRCFFSRILTATVALSLYPAVTNAATSVWNAGDGNWADGGPDVFWIPMDEPDANDTAQFQTDHTVTMTTDNEVTQINLFNGADLLTNRNDLVVQDAINVVNGSTFTVESTPLALDGVPGYFNSVMTDSVTVANGSTLFMAGALSYAETNSSGTFVIGPDSALVGNGSLSYDGLLLPTFTTVLDNNHQIVAREYYPTGGGDPSGPRALHLVAAHPNARADLDGTSEVGSILVDRFDTLFVDMPLADAFGGDLFLEDEAKLQLSHPWTMNDGAVNVSAVVPDTNPAVIEAPQFTQSGGTLAVAADGRLRFNAPFQSTGGAIELEGRLEFSANTTIDTGTALSVHGESILLALPNSEVAISQVNFDMDGASADSPAFWVGNEATLRITTGGYDAFGGLEAYGGGIAAAGELDIDVGSDLFVLTGEMFLIANAEDSARWTGDRLQVGVAAGVVDGEAPPTVPMLTATGSGRALMAAPLVIEASGTVEIDEGSTLRLGGGNGTDNSNLIAGGNVRPVPGTAGGPLNIASGRKLSGWGRIEADVDGEGAGTLEAEGGTLRVIGAITALGGLIVQPAAELRVDHDTTVIFEGEASVGAGGSLWANGFQLQFVPGSSLELDGGVYRSFSNTQFGGSLSVAGPLVTSTLAHPSFAFESTSVVDIQGLLNLNELAIVEAGAEFSGAGALKVLDRLILEDGAAVGVELSNFGTTIVGEDSIAQATLAAYTHADTVAAVEIEIAGSDPMLADRLDVSGLARLGGALDVEFLAGYVPNAWDEFTIVTFGNRLGEFDSVSVPVTLPLPLTYELVYTSSEVTLQFMPLFSADFDLDGDVDHDDFTQWQGDYGLNGDSDADRDGDSDGDDFLAWQQQLGSSHSAVTAVPEPASAVLVTASIALSVVSNHASRLRSLHKRI